jgi:hypothetical protein
MKLQNWLGYTAVEYIDLGAQMYGERHCHAFHFVAARNWLWKYVSILGCVTALVHTSETRMALIAVIGMAPRHRPGICTAGARALRCTPSVASCRFATSPVVAPATVMEGVKVNIKLLAHFIVK